MIAARRCAAPANRAWADFLAAFGCESVTDDKGLIQDTSLRTMSGAGHQHFLGFMRTLISDTTSEELHAAMFLPWRYVDPRPSMRWDPADDRRYAMRWDDPSGDPIRTVRGANRLAIEALPLLPTMPVGADLATTGFSRLVDRGIYWSWPIWDRPVIVEVVRSLLAYDELQRQPPDRRQLSAMGVREIYRSRRITQGKYRNFTPSFPA